MRNILFIVLTMLFIPYDYSYANQRDKDKQKIEDTIEQGSGDFDIKDSAVITGSLKVDTIDEEQSGVGVTIEGSLLKDGKVGIGTSPSHDLHIEKSSLINLFLKSSGTSASSNTYLYNDSNIGLIMQTFGSSASGTKFGTSASSTSYVRSTGTQGLAIGTTGASTLTLGTNDAPRMTIDSSGLATFSNGINLGDSTLNHYTTKTLLGAVTWTANNSSANTTANIHYAKIGNIVHVEFAPFTITTNASDTIIGSGTALPSGFRPAQRLMLPVSILSANYNYTWGVLNIYPDGSMSLYSTLSNNFWGAGTSGILHAVSVSFIIN